MTDVNRDGLPLRAVVAGAAVGLLATVLAVSLIPVQIWRFTAEILGAVAAAVTAVALAGSGMREDVGAAVVAELLRSLVVFLVLGVLFTVYSGEGPGFFAFFLLFGGGMAIVLGLVSVPVAAVVGAAASTARRSVRR